MRLLLDTDTVNYIVKDRPGVRERLRAAAEAEAEILLCPPVHYELFRYLRLRGATRLQEAYVALAAAWTWCSMTRADWDAAAVLWSDCQARGRPAGDFDVLIAAIARQRDAVVVTHNVRHFTDLGVPTTDWASE